MTFSSGILSFARILLFLQLGRSFPVARRERKIGEGRSTDYSTRGRLKDELVAELKRRDKPQAAASPRFPPSNLTYGPPTPHGWKF